MVIITRAGKGSALTWAEEDANFTELDNRTKDCWNTLRGSITIPPSGGPGLASYNGIQMLSFEADLSTELTIAFHMPKDYVAGGAIVPHGHILTATNSTGSVRWLFTMMAANAWVTGTTPIADSYQKFNSLGTAHVDDIFTADDKDINRIVSGGQMVIPWLAPDALVLMRLFRDGTHIDDTYPDSVFISFVDMYYQSTGHGASSL